MELPTTFFLGVDGGQSTTTALIGDETGRVVGSGTGGPCNHVGAAEGREKFLAALNACLSEACEQAKLDARKIHFEAACLGFSGGPQDKEALIREMLSANRLIVTHDALIGLVGATDGEPGTITIAGTGSMAFGRNASGNTARAGGWGYIFGDEGGGFDIARQALRAALRYEEGWGPHTMLHEKLLAVSGAAEMNDAMHRFYTTEFPRPRIASFAKVVDESARAGDHVARQILENAAQQLASLSGAVRAQLFAPQETARIAYIGGVFKSPLLLERFRLLIELEEGNQFGPPIHGPAAGALIEAYRAAGLEGRLSNLLEFEK